jgi:hypothetical protein
VREQRDDGDHGEPHYAAEDRRARAPAQAPLFGPVEAGPRRAERYAGLAARVEGDVRPALVTLALDSLRLTETPGAMPKRRKMRMHIIVAP